MKTVLSPPEVHPPPEPYSQAVRMGNVVFIAGQVALDDLRIVGQGDAQVQAKQAWTNIKEIVEAAGGTMADIGRIAV